jgi:hypothetical protein
MAKFQVHFKGIKPILFDRYPGNNTTKLPPEKKLYLTKEWVVYLPAINIYASLASDSPNCAAKLEFGKTANKIKIGIQSFFHFDESELIFSDDDGKPIVFEGFDEKRFVVFNHIAKVKKGTLSIPSPKERPGIMPPWNIRFQCELLPNEMVNPNDLKLLFERSQIMGHGTFRPQFGGFKMIQFEKID